MTEAVDFFFKHAKRDTGERLVRREQPVTDIVLKHANLGKGSSLEAKEGTRLDATKLKTGEGSNIKLGG